MLPDEAPSIRFSPASSPATGTAGMLIVTYFLGTIFNSVLHIPSLQKLIF